LIVSTFEIADDPSAGVTDRVYAGIMDDLEKGRLVTGQRLVETELAVRYGVGRNAVREAIQRLVARGIVDPVRNRSPAIRSLDRDQALDILEVAETMTGLAAAMAARAFTAGLHGAAMAAAMREVESASVTFGRARRGFYRTILTIGASEELQRIFPTIAVQLVYSRYSTPLLLDIRKADYAAMAEAICRGDTAAAERAARVHVQRVRRIVADLAVDPERGGRSGEDVSRFTV
jgi:DNA-binding GntR family transcriptional regulator